MQRSIIRPSAINLYGMPIEPRDSHTNRNYIVTTGALKGKLRFYFANVIVNDDAARDRRNFQFCVTIFTFHLYKNEVRKGE